MAAENHGHSHFILLMEEVVMALQPHFATSAGIESREAYLTPSTSAMEALENRFATLEVEELAESDGENTAGQIPSPPESQLLIYEIEPAKEKKDVEQDELFAIFCLFDDLDRLRSYVQDLWVNYKQQKIDLITASVTTNTAFQLAIRAQDEILAAYPEYSDYQDVLLTIMQQFIKAQGADEKEGEVEIDDDVAQWIFAPAHSILDSFCDVLKPKRVPLMKRGYYGIYDPRVDRDSLDDLQKNREDLILLMELLPDFCFLERYKLHLVATDELTRGLCNMVSNQGIPVWLTFATTVFLDIHHTLRGDVWGNPIILRNVATCATQTLNQYFELSQGLMKPSTWPAMNEKALHLFAKEIDEYVLSDAILPHKKVLLRAENMPQPPETEKFYLYKRHPILCGITAFTIMLEMQQMGVIMVNAMGTAIFPAHFYNALRQKQNPIDPWPLMDQVIALHGEDRMFVGAKPTTIVDCWKQMCLTLGVSTENFARNRRNPKLVASKNGPRGLKDTSTMNEIFYKGLRGHGTMTLTMHNIEELLNEQAQGGDSNTRLRRSWKTTKRLTSLQLLEALRLTIPAELKKLEVNYFRLHEQSVGLLRRLRTELNDDLRKFPGGLQLDNESQLPHMGIFVVQAVMGTQKVAEEMRIPEAGSKLLEKAGRVTNGFLRELAELPDQRPVGLTAWSS
jgi:hypothetical protein